MVSIVTQCEESFSKHLCFAVVIALFVKWAGYLTVAGLNLLLLTDRISPESVHYYMLNLQVSWH